MKTNRKASFFPVWIGVFAITMVLAACAPRIKVSDIPPPPPCPNEYMTAQQHLVQSTVWLQQSAEYRAICWQTYALAQLRLDQYLQNRKSENPAAVVVDVDETVLDNSPYTGYNILSGNPYTFEDWKAWTDLAQADTIAGACHFLKYAASKGVDVYYITNRKAVETGATIENLRKFGFPNADSIHVLTRVDVGSKEPRRQTVLATHEIVLLVGDAMTDFGVEFEGLKLEDLRSTADNFRQEFGSRYIVMPNPLYGGWEGAVRKGLKDLSEQQQDSLRKNALRNFSKD